MASPVVTGTYVGTGAAVDVELGFKPSHVRIINIPDRDAGLEWFDSMPDGTGVVLGAALASQAANGITPLDGTLDGATKEGFTAGSAVSESGKTFAYIATRSVSY